MARLTVIGAGSWGTALAVMLARNGHAVALWGRDGEALQRLEETREAPHYLPGIRLPDAVLPEADLARALAGAEGIVLAVPSSAVRATTVNLAVHRPPGAPFVIATKGLEPSTGLRMSEVVIEAFDPTIQPPHDPLTRPAVLTGPNLAAEVVSGVPTGSVVACEDAETAETVAGWFRGPSWRLYATDDVTGAELGGALKNVIAVAAGIGDGLGFGANTKAALLTRGLAEITRLGVAAGGRAGTFAGLSGVGDLVATATSPLSRNRRFGETVGRGAPPAEAAASLGHVAEGVTTCPAALLLAARHAVEMPITTTLAEVLQERLPPRDAVSALLARAPRADGE
jgi:glycerol-3-phosphate dehydrogenase (NAD(P)+)